MRVGGAQPGRDDNASGVAVLIELATRIARRPHRLSRTVRFVAFTNEEEPFFRTSQMGSRRYVETLMREATDGTAARAMLSLETLGYYRDDPGTQELPCYLRPFVRRLDAGNFLAFVGDTQSHDLVERVQRVFRAHVRLPAEGIVARGSIPGIGWSDHSSFWRARVPAVMVTDTAPKRNHCYHRDCDLPERLDYERMAHVVEGLEAVIVDLATRRPGDDDLASE